MILHWFVVGILFLSEIHVLLTYFTDLLMVFFEEILLRQNMVFHLVWYSFCAFVFASVSQALFCVKCSFCQKFIEFIITIHVPWEVKFPFFISYKYFAIKSVNGHLFSKEKFMTHVTKTICIWFSFDFNEWKCYKQQIDLCCQSFPLLLFVIFH